MKTTLWQRWPYAIIGSGPSEIHSGSFPPMKMRKHGKLGRSGGSGRQWDRQECSHPVPDKKTMFKQRCFVFWKCACVRVCMYFRKVHDSFGFPDAHVRIWPMTQILSNMILNVSNLRQLSSVLQKSPFEIEAMLLLKIPQRLLHLGPFQNTCFEEIQ